MHGFLISGVTLNTKFAETVHRPWCLYRSKTRMSFYTSPGVGMLVALFGLAAVTAVDMLVGDVVEGCDSRQQA
jgi:hypothetical protein